MGWSFIGAQTDFEAQGYAFDGFRGDAASPSMDARWRRPAARRPSETIERIPLPSQLLGVGRLLVEVSGRSALRATLLR